MVMQIWFCTHLVYKYIKGQELQSYCEAITNKESTQWIGTK